MRLNALPPDPIGRALAYAVSLFLLVTVICVFVPLSPMMPKAGLDDSWMLGMNQAVAQHLSIGRELVFTFGPYASVFTEAYHPAVDGSMLVTTLTIAVLYWSCIARLAPPGSVHKLLAIALLLACVMYRRDALLFSYPLLVGLVAWHTVVRRPAPRLRRLSQLHVGLLFIPLGLLPLVKGSLIVVCSAMVVLCAIHFAWHRERRLALGSVLCFVASMVVFWLLAGQSLADLPAYLVNTLRSIAGYTEAMANEGDWREIAIYLVAAAAVMLAAFLHREGPLAARMFITLVCTLFLFVSFKSAFVRHDEHAVIASTALVLVVAFLALLVRSRAMSVAIAFAALAWLMIDHDYVRTSSESIVTSLKTTYLSKVVGLRHRLQDRRWPKDEYDATLAEIHRQQPLPTLAGTSDIYSFNQAILIASGNRWTPRPGFQSYAAYAPAHALRNRDWLLGANAPDHLFFRVETIDSRMPSLDDGASWPALLARYRPVGEEEGYLLLARNEPGAPERGESALVTRTYALGERVDVPTGREPVFARFDIRPTLWGRVVGIAFKPGLVHIVLTLADGGKRRYRLITGMATSGLLLSPLVESTADMASLYRSLADTPLHNVESFVLLADAGSEAQWQSRYDVTFSRITAVPASAATARTAP